MSPIVKIFFALLFLGLLAWYFWPKDNSSEIISVIPAQNVSGSEISIIAFGDSLTAGYGLPQGESYPALLKTALLAEGFNVEVINAGVSGETTRGNLERAEFIQKQNPHVILLGIGGNDALRSLPLEETKANISKTVDILRSGENPPVVILLQMQGPLNSGFAYKQDFDRIYEEVADEKEILLIPFLTAEVFLESTNKLSDGIHLNKIGYQKVVDLYILPVLREVLERL